MTRVITDERRVRRRPLDASAAVAVDGQLLFKCRMKDFSDAGACVDTSGQNTPERFQLIDIAAGVAYSVRIVWRKPDTVGVAFLHARELDAPDAPEWLAILWRQLRSEEPKARGRAAA